MGIVNKNNYLNTSLAVVIKKHTNIFKWKKKINIVILVLKLNENLKKKQVNIIFSSIFWIKVRSYFPSPKRSNEDLSHTL